MLHLLVYWRWILAKVIWNSVCKGSICVFLCMEDLIYKYELVKWKKNKLLCFVPQKFEEVLLRVKMHNVGDFLSICLFSYPFFVYINTLLILQYYKPHFNGYQKQQNLEQPIQFVSPACAKAILDTNHFFTSWPLVGRPSLCLYQCNHTCILLLYGFSTFLYVKCV